MNPSQRQLSGYGWRPADPLRRPVLFVNPRSGGGKAAAARVAERAREKGIEAVVLAAGQDLAALAGEAVTAGADALGMAGGDGSLAVVAAALYLVDDLGREHRDLVVVLVSNNPYALDRPLARGTRLRAGDRVLLAAVPGQGILAAHSFAVVDQALRAHGTFPHAPGGQP